MGKRYGPVIQPLLGGGSENPDSIKRLKIEPNLPIDVSIISSWQVQIVHHSPCPVCQ